MALAHAVTAWVPFLPKSHSGYSSGWGSTHWGSFSLSLFLLDLLQWEEVRA